MHWDYLGECFGPAESGWDDLAIWTGSVVRDGGHWRMFYTAVNSEGHGVYDQRIGSATSTDLHTWTRVGHQPAPTPTRAGTRRSPIRRRRSPTWPRSRAAARPGATRWPFPTRTATAGTC